MSIRWDRIKLYKMKVDFIILVKMLFYKGNLGLKGRKSEGFNYIKRFYWSTKDRRVIYYKKTGLSLIENTRDVFTYEWKFYSERTRNEQSVNRARNQLCIPINKYVAWTRSKWDLFLMVNLYRMPRTFAVLNTFSLENVA